MGFIFSRIWIQVNWHFFDRVQITVNLILLIFFYLCFISFLFTFHSRISVHFLQVLCIYWNSLCVKVKVMQSCLTLCYPMDCRMPGSSVYGTLQARTLERVAIPFTRESSQDRDQTQVSLCWMILYHLNHQGSPETLYLTQILFSYILFQVLGYPIKRLWEALLNPSLETSWSHFQFIIYLFFWTVG